MKDYMQMAQSVLKRRDEILEHQKTRRTFPVKKVIAFGAPATALAVGVFAAAVHFGNTEELDFTSQTETFIENGTVSNFLTEPAQSTAAPEKEYEGKPDRIRFENVGTLGFSDMAYDEKYFVPKTIDELNSYYHRDILLLTASGKYSDWEFSARPYGFYIDEGNDGTVAWRSLLSTENVVCYTSGDKMVRVMLSSTGFGQPDSVSEIPAPPASETSANISESNITAFEEYTPAFEGGLTSEPTEETSIINGFGVSLKKTANGEFFADLKYYDYCHVGIYSIGISEEEFLSDVRAFTE